MFFVLTDHSGAARPHFGYLIAKNPASPPFDRSLSGSSDAIGRRVVGRYEGEEMNPNTYVVTVENDELAWMKMLREANKPHYVSAAPYAVTPLNLKGLGVAFKTALDGKDASKGVLPEGEVSAPRHWTAVLGPFVLPEDFVLDVYGGLGLAPCVPRVSSDDRWAWVVPLSMQTAVTVMLEAVCPLAEFLQKVLVGAYALTLKQHTEKYLDDGLVGSLMRMSLSWIDGVPNKDRIMARLSQGSTDVLQTWAEAIRGDAEEPAETETETETEAEISGTQVRRVSLHARRHEVILRHIPHDDGAAMAHTSLLRVVDLGCGDGKLAVKILKERPGSKVLAIDADAMNLAWLFRNVRRAFKRPREKAPSEGGKLPLVVANFAAKTLTLAEEEPEAVPQELEPSIKSRFKDRQDNVVLPEVEDHERDPDVLVLSEVIEHLLPEDRAKLIDNVATLWRAKQVILTTPNRDYNFVFGLKEGAFRHKDHKVEYDATDLLREVIEPLQRRGYAVRVVPLLTPEDRDGPYTLVSYANGGPAALLALATKTMEAREKTWDVLIQPSWIVVADRCEGAKSEYSYKSVYEAREAHAPVHLHESGYSVRHGEMIVGLCHPVYLGHRTNLAWLAPTVPPVEHVPTHPQYLEHPQGAFDYYAARGVSELVAEVKYMGSRLTVTAFVDHRAAAGFGYTFKASEAPIFAWSRQGYPFFNEGDALTWRLHESLLRGGFFEDNDVIVLDGEFLPWSFKAGRGERNLITQAFQAPGEAARIDAAFKNDPVRVEQADLFLRALRKHAASMEPAFVPFDVKLTGRVNLGQRWLDKSKLNWRTRAYMLRWLEERIEQSREEGFDSLLVACEWHPVYLENEHVDTPAQSVELWEAWCAAGGEGFVYKPMRPSTLPDGSPVQPALKVRGQDYLRLIYGMRYLEPDYFEKVKRRNVAAKRRLALQENLLADRILRAFMHGERREKDRYVAAFLGIESVETKAIDATL